MKLPRLLLALAAVAVTLAAPTPAYAAESLIVKLQDVNRTGAGGTATLAIDEAGNLTVTITASGLAPNLPHLQHLHRHYPCPTRSADHDRDGYVSASESTLMDSDIFISLTTTGDTTWTSGLAVNRMPLADAQGNLSYQRTIPAAELPAGTAEHLGDLQLLQHGVDANHNGTYDLAGLGESTFAREVGVPNIPEEETAPATCGLVAGAAAGAVPAGGIEVGDGSRTTSAPLVLGPALLILLLILLLLPLWRRRRLLSVATVLLLLAGCGHATSSPPPPTPTRLPSSYPVLTTGPLMSPSPPTRVTIPKLHTTSGFIGLGRNPDGSMTPPPDADAVGWFTGAPTPGALGPAVLAGHEDWDGKEGAFADLKELAPGDRIIVDRADGSTAVFVVTRVEQHAKTAFPTAAVYGPTDHAALRLITCGGPFETATHHYRDNVVVFADLSEAKPGR